MPVAPLRAPALLFASLTLAVLALLLALHDRSQPTTHYVAVLTLIVGAVALAWASRRRATPRGKRRTKHRHVRLWWRST